MLARQEGEQVSEGAPAGDEELHYRAVDAGHNPVEHRSCGDCRAERKEQKRHELHDHVHLLLLGVYYLVPVLHRHSGLDELGDSRGHREYKEPVGLRDMFEPQEVILAHRRAGQVVDGTPQSKEEGDLNECRQASGGRIEAVLPVERHRLRARRCPVLAVFLVDLADHGGQLLLTAGTAECGQSERQENSLCQDREDDDGDASAVRSVVQAL